MFSGCGYKYTIVSDNNLKLSAISKTTIAVFPVGQIQYSPPSSCLFPADLSKEPVLRNDWNADIQAMLQKNFPEQKFVFLTENDDLLNNAGGNLSSLYSRAERNTAAQRVSRSSSNQIYYMPMDRNSSLQPFFNQLREKTEAQYAVFFLTPSLTGEIQTSYNAGTGSFSSTKYYTADIQIQIWDCTSSQLMYSSGGWNKSAGYCFFVSPENVSIHKSNKEMFQNLFKAISSLLNNLPSQLSRSY
jgi:hypothetical protein